jgi:hypothetical protein
MLRIDDISLDQLEWIAENIAPGGTMTRSATVRYLVAQAYEILYKIRIGTDAEGKPIPKKKVLPPVPLPFWLDILQAQGTQELKKEK